jgi:hypothetical protein
MVNFAMKNATETNFLGRVDHFVRIPGTEGTKRVG